MKKQRSLEEMTHQDLIEALIFDENIQDNLYVSNDYAPDEYGNNIISMGFEEQGKRRKKGLAGFILFAFNPKGRLVSIEVAIRKRGNKEWQLASSEKLIDFESRYGTDMPMSKIKKGKS